MEQMEKQQDKIDNSKTTPNQSLLYDRKNKITRQRFLDIS